MTLHINESEVRELLTMPAAISAVEEVSRKQAEATVIVHPRRRFELPNRGYFHYMAALDTADGYVGMKQYTYVKGKLCFLVPLYSVASGELLALIEADYMGQLRTGAASGVATKYLARKHAKVAAIIGTGGQARTQLEAIHNVRMLDAVYVFGRDEQRRKKFCDEMTEQLEVTCYPMQSAADAVRNAEIICTATTSSQPVLNGLDLAPGVHINAIGANHAHKQELDEAAVARANLIYVDSLAQSKQEAGDLIIPFAKQPERWAEVHELADLIAGKVPGRANDSQITLFKSNGIASWDLAVAGKVYSLAKEKGLGRQLPLYTSTG
ncbi:MAG TPA: ornithine cyclodeaminase family protein [Candidatus Sulfotelmatobacter sp.]|nr:ornithine cyclodeaminase family protein [Candidatus Sulfotelmatobacter sp.]